MFCVLWCLLVVERTDAWRRLGAYIRVHVKRDGSLNSFSLVANHICGYNVAKRNIFKITTCKSLLYNLSIIAWLEYS